MSYVCPVRFAWDPKKAAANLRKHQVSFEEAATALADPLGLEKEDAIDPARTVVVCMSDRPRLLLCVYAEIDEDPYRIISARRATAHERRAYEEGH